MLHATWLLDQVRERIRYKHYSLRTEQAYVQWVRVFVKWHGLRHPRDMGQLEIEGFLAMLANERWVTDATTKFNWPVFSLLKITVNWSASQSLEWVKSQLAGDKLRDNVDVTKKARQKSQAKRGGGNI